MNVTEYMAFIKMRIRWDSAPKTQEDVQEWVVYCVIWKDNSWTPPGAWIFKWSKQPPTEYSRMAIEIYVRPGIINIPRS